MMIIIPLNGNSFVEDGSVIEAQYVPKPLGSKGILAADLDIYGNTITLDGDISDWSGVPHDVFDDVDIYLAYDSTNVYIAAQWKDLTFGDRIGYWNKTDMIDADDALWEYVRGFEDRLIMGFYNDSYSDLWSWTSTNKTLDPYVYEFSFNEEPDGGIAPFEYNQNDTYYHHYNIKPIYDNTHVPIVDWAAIPLYTRINAYLPLTPTGSQTDVSVSMDWSNTKAGYYTIEFTRPLDTGQVDDFVFDFSQDDLYFYLELGNDTEQRDFDCYYGSWNSYLIDTTNEPSDFTIEPIVDYTTGTLLVKGTVYDDYENYDFRIRLSGWNETLDLTFGEYWEYPYVNRLTGNWSYLFNFDSQEMPLGDHVITIFFEPKYEDNVTIEHDITIDDIVSPTIFGFVDVLERYPYGVPNNTKYVTITVGTEDDYSITDNLTAMLFYQIDDQEILHAINMTQFSSGGRTFNGNITLDYTFGAANNYTYYVEVIDENLNTITTEALWFIVGDYTPPPTTTICYIFLGSLSLGLLALSLIASM
ncbi:MAG: hypothetical protein ACTSSH_02530, partial [Candidatus Heimdallarchaeota archaeon]